MKKCQFCAEMIDDAAPKCPYCERPQDSVAAAKGENPTATKATLEANQRRSWRKPILIGVIGVVVAIAMVSLFGGPSEYSIREICVDPRTDFATVRSSGKPLTGVVKLPFGGFWEVKDGLAHGRYKDFHNVDVPKSEKEYKNGVPHGTHISYSLNGRIEERKVYVDGALIEHQTFYDNGQTSFHGFWKNKLLTEDKRYDNSGKLEKETQYQPDGSSKCVEYHPNGKPKKVSFYDKRFNLDGKCEEYYENGNLYAESYFQNGMKLPKGKSFSPDGKVDAETTIDSKGFVTYTTFSESGAIRTKTVTENDQLFSRESYTDNGLLMEKVTRKGDKMITQKCQYHDNGKMRQSFLSFKTLDVNAMPFPIRNIEYDQNGNVIKDEKYETGFSLE